MIFYALKEIKRLSIKLNEFYAQLQFSFIDTNKTQIRDFI